MSTHLDPAVKGGKAPDNKEVGADRKEKTQGRLAALLITPTIVVLAIVIAYPVIDAIIMSLQQDEGLDPATGTFVAGGFAGFANYIHWLFQQCTGPGGVEVSCPPGTLGAQFWSATGTTFFFTVVTVFFETILGFWMAVIMARAFRGRSVLRAAVLVPWAIPTAVTCQHLVQHLDSMDRKRGAGPRRHHHCRYLEDHTFHGTADSGRPANDPFGYL